ncbi:MAG: hypothetical protein ACXVCS_18790 [Bdellovibrionota bacterium]
MRNSIKFIWVFLLTFSAPALAGLSTNIDVHACDAYQNAIPKLRDFHAKAMEVSNLEGLAYSALADTRKLCIDGQLQTKSSESMSRLQAVTGKMAKSASQVVQDAKPIISGLIQLGETSCARAVQLEAEVTAQTQKTVATQAAFICAPIN